MSKSKLPSRETLYALHKAEQRRRDDLRAADQRALTIKEQGDRTALDLARDIQIYKDEKANELRSQIESERGSYATKKDLDSAVDKIRAEMRAAVANSWTRVIALAGIVVTAGIALYLGLGRN